MDFLIFDLSFAFLLKKIFLFLKFFEKNLHPLAQGIINENKLNYYLICLQCKFLYNFITESFLFFKGGFYT